MSRGFDTYWLAGGEIWAAKAGAPCEIDLELAVALHALHVREAVACAHDGDRGAAADHRDRAGELARIIREQSEMRSTTLNAWLSPHETRDARLQRFVKEE